MLLMVLVVARLLRSAVLGVLLLRGDGLRSGGWCRWCNRLVNGWWVGGDGRRRCVLE